MDAVLMSTKGQVVLPIAVRKALGLKPGMRVSVVLDGKRAVLTPAPSAEAASLEQLQALLRYDGPPVPMAEMRVTDYKTR
jgi:AbrB family looped-hinge helix DNA binding protein